MKNGREAAVSSVDPLESDPDEAAFERALIRNLRMLVIDHSRHHRGLLVAGAKPRHGVGGKAIKFVKSSGEAAVLGLGSLLAKKEFPLMRKILIGIALVCGMASANAAEKSDDAFGDVREELKEAHAGERCLFAKDPSGKPLPKVVIKKDRIEILDGSGNPTTTIAREDDAAQVIETHVYPDPHGKVVGVHVTKGLDPAKESWKTGEYYILDVTGRKTLELKPFNDGTHPLPSPSGDYAVGWTNEMGPPLFYDAQGTRNKWARRWYDRAKRGFTGEQVDEWPDMFEASTARFASDGSRVAVFGRGPGPRSAVFVYDSSGNNLFHMDGALLVVFSHDGSRLAYILGGGKVGVRDMSGAVIWETQTNMGPAKFSDDGKSLIVSGGNRLGVLDALTGKIIWTWQPTEEKLAELRHGEKPTDEGPLKGDPGFGFALVAATSDFTRIVALALTMKEIPLWPGKPQRRLTSDKDHFLVFDNQGHLLAWKELPGNTFPGVIADLSISISTDGNAIAVPGSDGMHYFYVRSSKESK